MGLGHHHEQNKNEALRTVIISLSLSVILCIIKWISGILGNSEALIADAIESTTDILSSFVLFFGIKFAYIKADDRHPYGHGRIETIVAFLLGLLLIASSALIIFRSVSELNTEKLPPHGWTLFILAIIIIWKELCFRYLMAKSKKTYSSSLKAEAWHHRSDAFTSVAAFIGVFIAVFCGDKYVYADNIAAIIAAIVLLYNSGRILYDVIIEIMDEKNNPELIKQIREESLKVLGVIGTEKCFLRKYGMYYHVDLHLIVDANITVREGHQIAHHAKDHLMQQLPQIHNILIHVEPDKYDD